MLLITTDLGYGRNIRQVVFGVCDDLYENGFGVLIDGGSVCLGRVLSNPMYADSPLFKCDLELVVGLTRARGNELRNCPMYEVLTPP